MAGFARIDSQIRANRPIHAKHFRGSRTEALFCEARLGALKIANRRFEAIRANRSNVLKIIIKSALRPPPPPQNPKSPPPKRGILWTWFCLQKERIFPGAHKIGAAISGPRIAGRKFYGHEDLSEIGIFLRVDSCNPPSCYRSLSGPSGPKCAGSVPENGGVWGSFRRGGPTALWAPGLPGLSKKCPKSVPRVSKRCPGHSGDTLGTLCGHSGARGPKNNGDTPSNTPVFRDNVGDTLGPKGLRDSCRRSDGLQVESQKNQFARNARLFVILFVHNFWRVYSQFWLGVRNSVWAPFSTNSRGNPALCWLAGGGG